MPPLDQVALAIEALAEKELPAPVAPGRDVGRGTSVLDQLADWLGVACLVSEHGGAAEVVEQRVGIRPSCDPCQTARSVEHVMAVSG